MSAADVKERPILFSAPMVRALLDGSKTQTRRAIKPQPYHVDGGVPFGDPPAWAMRQGAAAGSAVMKCRYGKRGDRLWVRETWGYNPDFEGVLSHVCYRADPEHRYDDIRWRPSIHMPRRASRIALGVTEVRVERLQAISEVDAVAEGIERRAEGFAWYTGRDAAKAFTMNPLTSYRSLWERINGAGSWDANPWVWCVSFRRVEG